MAHRTCALAMALAFLTPLALAEHGDAEVADPAGDERVSFVGTLPEGRCDAPAADILALRLRVEGDELAVSLDFRDPRAPATCVGNLEARRGAGGWSVYMGNFSTRTHVRLDAQLHSNETVRGCVQVIANGGWREACTHTSFDEAFTGPTSTLRVPLQGTVRTLRNQTDVPYDLRELGYDVDGSSRAVYYVTPAALGPTPAWLSASDSAFLEDYFLDAHPSEGAP